MRQSLLFTEYILTYCGLWVKGLCVRWTGVNWEAVEIKADGTFETNPYVAALMDLTEGAPGGTFMSLLVRDLVAKTAMIENITAKLLRIHDGGAIYGGGYDQNGNPTGGPGFHIGTDGKIRASQGIFDKVETFDMDIKAKGYLPIGFIYFQIRDQPEPGTIFEGTWENISGQYAGLFFRVEGGNAASFGNNQGDNVGNHKHEISASENNRSPNRGGNHADGVEPYWTSSYYTENNQDSIALALQPDLIETRPKNTTIRVWKRIS
jgi:hypothetical protein